MSEKYHEYLASREWALLREKIRERSGDYCERCFVAPQQAVHHLTYERLGHERLEDLQAICNACHEFQSGKSDYDPAADVIVVCVALTKKQFLTSEGQSWVYGLRESQARLVGKVEKETVVNFRNPLPGTLPAWLQPFREI